MIQVSLFFRPTNDVTLETKGCYRSVLLQWSLTKIRKMTVKGVKLKSESFFLISPGVFELWRENLRKRIV